jgi:hypothetical protein
MRGLATGDPVQLSQPTPTGDSALLRILEWIASAAGGALVTFVGFRTKLAMMDGRMDRQDEKIEEQVKSISDHRNNIAMEAMRAERSFRETIERLSSETNERHEDNQAQLRLMRSQQLLTLKMIADIARQTGADKRFDDEVWRLLADISGARHDE